MTHYILAPSLFAKGWWKILLSERTVAIVCSVDLAQKIVQLLNEGEREART